MRDFAKNATQKYLWPERVCNTRDSFRLDLHSNIAPQLHFRYNMNFQNGISCHLSSEQIVLKNENFALKHIYGSNSCTFSGSHFSKRSDGNGAETKEITFTCKKSGIELNSMEFNMYKMLNRTGDIYDTFIAAVTPNDVSFGAISVRNNFALGGWGTIQPGNLSVITKASIIRKNKACQFDVTHIQTASENGPGEGVLQFGFSLGRAPDIANASVSLRSDDSNSESIAFNLSDSTTLKHLFHSVPSSLRLVTDFKCSKNIDTLSGDMTGNIGLATDMVSATIGCQLSQTASGIETHALLGLQLNV